MKIAFIFDRIFPYYIGGAEKRYYELARHLSHKHEIHFLGIKSWSGPNTLVCNNVHIHGICPIPRLYINGRRAIAPPFYFGIRLLPHLLRESFDVIDCSSTPYVPLYTAALCSRIKKTPLVATWLDFWGDYWRSYLGYKGYAAQMIERMGTLLPDRIIPISQRTTRTLLQAHLRPDKLSTLPCGVDWEEASDVMPSSETSDVTYLGRLVQFKGVGMLIHAIAELKKDRPRIRCHIIGEGPQYSDLIALAARSGVSDNVKFLGRVEGMRNVYALLKASKVLVHPSTWEGFGLVLLEANACGLPVVAMDSEGNSGRELVKNGENGILCSPTPDAIRQAVGMLLDDTQNRQRMASSALESVRQRPSWKEVADRLVAIYADVLIENRHPVSEYRADGRPALEPKVHDV